jgi:hypothetical protein
MGDSGKKTIPIIPNVWKGLNHKIKNDYFHIQKPINIRTMFHSIGINIPIEANACQVYAIFI